jgi:hypothetical protein
LNSGSRRVTSARAVAHVLFDQGHQLRRLHQRFLGRLAVARVQVATSAIQHEGQSRREDQQDADKNAVAFVSSRWTYEVVAELFSLSA